MARDTLSAHAAEGQPRLGINGSGLELTSVDVPGKLPTELLSIVVKEVACEPTDEPVTNCAP